MESLIQDIPRNMDTIKTEDFIFEDLKEQWKSATINDWLNYIKEKITTIQTKYNKNPDPYYGVELLLLAKKLEIIAKQMGGTNSSWLDPKK